MVALLIVIAVLVVQIVLAARALTAARSDASALARDLSSGNLKQAHQDAEALKRHANAANSAVGGPLWWLGSQVPWAGENLAAVHDTAGALDVIATRSMPVLLNLADQVEHGSLRPRDGRISPTAIAAFAPSIRSAADALDSQAAQIARINASSLIGPLQSTMRKVQSRVHEAQVTLNAAANAFSVLPSMLGGSGPRNYLLIVQNPAEIRAAGGLAGTWAILHADDGRLKLISASNAGAFTPKSQVVRPTAEEGELFGSDWGLTATDATVSPDFPRDAQLATAMAAQHGYRVSAVFSVDPIALSYVLRGTGPVSVTPKVTLTASNVVSVLLSQIYQTMDPDQQNIFYANAAGKIFHALVAGQGSQLNAIRGLVEGVSHHRVFAWSADPALAKVVNAESLTGALPTNTGTTPQVGVYLNDGVPGKQEYYLRQETSARSLSCTDGVQDIELKAQFASMMPASASKFPPWIVGDGTFAPRTHMLITLYIAGPWRGVVDSVLVDGSPVTVTANELDGRQMAMVPIELAPGQSMSVTARMHTGAGQTGSGKLTWTPGMTTGANPAGFASSC